MALNAQQGSIELVRDERGNDRRTLRLETQTSSTSGGSAAAVILNISETGILIETATTFFRGETLDVDLPETGLRTAEIVWRSDELYGCRFLERLTPANVSAALVRAPYMQPAPAVEQREVVHDDRLPLPQRLRAIVLLTVVSWVLVGAIVWLLMR